MSICWSLLYLSFLFSFLWLFSICKTHTQVKLLYLEMTSIAPAPGLLH
jgi:hypothetical protein